MREKPKKRHQRFPKKRYQEEKPPRTKPIQETDGEKSQALLEKAVAYWNERIETIIKPEIDSHDDKELAAFMWSQLVWQEIDMFISLGRAPKEEIDWLCNRRGFNDTQVKFLNDAIEHLGLPQ